MRRALFLDRDGTLIRNRPYLASPDGVSLMPRAVEGVKAFVRAGYIPIVITNQSGIARGLFTLDDLAAVNERLEIVLAAKGVTLAGVYFCPHLPGGSVKKFAKACACRKPKPGLLRRAARELRIDLAASVFIGDSEADAGAGAAAGVRTLIVGRDVATIAAAARLVTRTA